MRVPPAETKLTANYHVNIVIPRKPGWHVDGDVTLAKSTVAGVEIDDGAKASFLFEPGVVHYSADMNVANVDLKRIGDQFNIGVQNPRYETTLNGHVMANVRGTAVETMDLTASGTLHDSSLFGGRVPRLTFESTLAHDALHVKAQGVSEDQPGDRGRQAGRGRQRQRQRRDRLDAQPSVERHRSQLD